MIFRERRRNNSLLPYIKTDDKYDMMKEKKIFFHTTEYMIFESLQTKSSFHREDVWESEWEIMRRENTVCLSLCVCLIFLTLLFLISRLSFSQILILRRNSRKANLGAL